MTQLENLTVTTFAKTFTERGLDSFSEALLCLVPALRTHEFLLPCSEDMLPALLQAAEAYRKLPEWDKAQTMLRWACAQCAPNRGRAEEKPATTPSSPEPPLQELPVQRVNSIAVHWLYNTLVTREGSLGEVASSGWSRPIALRVRVKRLPGFWDCYEAIAQRIASASADTNSQPDARQI